MGTAHTPGPWHRGTGKAVSIIYAADGYAVASAEIYHGRHTAPVAANAALIAAAPDMLAALQAVIAADDANMADAVDYRTGHGEFASLRRAAGLARAAIARAEGRT